LENIKLKKLDNGITLITENLPPLENENWRLFNHSDKELIQVIRNNNILNKENNNIKKKRYYEKNRRSDSDVIEKGVIFSISRK